MAKRYYWLKLKDTYLESPKIKKLRRIAGGDTYTIIYLKMQLLSVKNEGVLAYEGIEETFAEELALKLDEDPENVEITLSYMKSQKLIEEVSDNTFLLCEASNSIGSEVDSTERVRAYRNKKALQCNAGVTACNAVETDCNTNETACNTDIDREKDIDKEIEIDSELERDSHKEREPEQKTDSYKECESESHAEQSFGTACAVALTRSVENDFYAEECGCEGSGYAHPDELCESNQPPIGAADAAAHSHPMESDCCSDVYDADQSGYSHSHKSCDTKPKRTISSFNKPSIEEVADYCRERRNNIDPQRFVDYYDANGWKLGRTPMRNWRAAVRLWEGREAPSSPAPNRAAEADYSGNSSIDFDAIERYMKSLP